jgi:hypothetical protein
MASIKNTYHTLDIPLNPSPYGVDSPYSPLQDLYPGRPMNVYWGLNEYDIPHERPVAAKIAFQENKKDTKKAAALLDALAYSQGSGKKVLLHAVSDPVSLIEEPDLKSVDIVKPTELEFPVKDNLLPIKEGFQNIENDKNESTNESTNVIYIITITFLIVLICSISVILSRK